MRTAYALSPMPTRTATALATRGRSWSATPSEQLQDLVDSGSLGRVDVLKVGHHGSKNALTPEVAQALRPALSLVSVGQGNRYGHPAAQTLDCLEQLGSRVMRTDESGDVVCEFAKGGISVKELG